MELRIWGAYVKTSQFMDKSTYINVFTSGLCPNRLLSTFDCENIVTENIVIVFTHAEV